MRLLHVVESLDRGGLERVVCDLAMAQRQAGHQVEVLCLFTRGSFADELAASGVPVHAAGKLPGLDWATLKTIRATIRRSGHELVHTHNPVANYYCCLAELFSAGQLPIVNTRHNMGARNPNDRREKLFSLSVRRTARVAMVSPQVSERFIAAGVVPAHKAVVAMNAIPVQRYTAANAASRRAARQRLGLDDGAPVVGSVGRLVAVKNHALLLEAVAPLCRRWPALRIVLIGTGDLRAALHAQARELGIEAAMVLTGERSDIPEVLPALDIFAAPSLSEGHSIALLEAACCGVPAVATAVGGNPAIVQDGRTGLLVPSGDAPALRAALACLLEEPARRQAIGRAAREWAEQAVSIDAMRRNYDAVYEAALRRA